MKSMKRGTGWFCVLLMVSAILTGCGQGAGKDEGVFDQFESDSQYVLDKGSLVVGVTDFEPLDYVQDGKWVGFDAEMAGMFAEELGVSVQFVEIDWDSKTDLLNKGTIDCVWNGMTLSDKVQEEMACSEAYLNNAQMIVVAEKNASKFQTVEDCGHLLFAVEAGSVGVEGLKARKYRYSAVNSQMDALESVVSGKADAAVIDAIMAGALIGEGKQFENLVCIDSMSSEEFGVGFRKDSDLAERLNSFLRESYGEGTMLSVAEKYGVQAAVIPLE